MAKQAKFALLLLSLSVGGCTSKEVQVAQPVPPLSKNRHLPVEEIESFIAAEKWREICDLEICRYVVLNATIREDGAVRIGSVSESYPDASWNEIARSFGQDVSLQPSVDLS